MPLPDQMDAETLSNALREQFQSLHTRFDPPPSQHISQRELERLLGLSQGYLCRLRRRWESQSAILAKTPKKRLAEVERSLSVTTGSLHL